MEEFAWKAMQVVLQSAISGVIVGLVAWGALKATVANIKVHQEELAARLTLIGTDLVEMRAERAACEVRSSREYARREDLNQIFAKLDSIADRVGERVESLRREVHEDSQHLHGRVTEVATRLATFQGEA